MQSKPNESSVNRRSFLQRSSLFGAAAAFLPMAGLLSTPRKAQAAPAAQSGLSDSDLAVLSFLAAAELVETDLWQQYTELATNNVKFRKALESIDEALPDYIMGDRDDENSHANLINGYLVAMGYNAVNLDGFRTLPSVQAKGAQQIGRLTNLTSLTVDTSWYFRYRNSGNPDFGDTFPQIVNIAKRPTIPTSDKMSNGDYKAIAQTAAFHFATIEQGGSSLYLSLLPKVTNLDVVSILGAIGPTEFYHFAIFQTSLENIKPLKRDGLVFPELKKGGQYSQKVTPAPCTFLDASLPVCSVIRPSSTANAGAVAAATGLVNSGLFAGQSNDFFNAVVGLATAADAAQRGSV
jgi:hypothetical protein